MASLKAFTPRPPAGFTIFEFLVVTGIFAVLASISLFVGFDVYRSTAFHDEVRTAATLLATARSRAMSNTNAAPHGVAILPSQYVVFEGASYGANPAQDEATAAAPSVSRIGMTEVVFAQLTGDATVTGGDLVLTDGVHSSTIAINNEGRIDW
jgi:prepilin-type N-terminal cleavage/methylation domain-containing protein